MKSERIKLINCDKELIGIILKGDAYLSKELNITVPTEWSVFGRVIFEYTRKRIQEEPSSAIWLAYLPIDIKTNTLLGNCGYKGAPDKEGMVEIGYEVAKDYRNQGYATEITRLLIQKAFEDKTVNKIQAHTLAEQNASVRVLEKCGFSFIKEYYEEEEEGLIWKWMKEK